MKTAGVVLDFYDDPTGELLKRTFPTPDDLPESIKTAHILNPDERDVLRNEAFALVMKDEGTTFRKFACVDKGNTILSCMYFEENADKLPQEAIKVAAANLASFCKDFNLAPTSFIKTAAQAKKTPMSAAGKQRDPMQQPLVGDEADWASRTNLVSIRGGADSGRVIPTANQMKTANVRGDGGVFHHSTPPLGAQGTGGHTLSDDKKHNGPDKKIAKLQNHKDLGPKTRITKKPSDDYGGVEITGENGADTDWPKVANIVDVSGKEPQVFVQKVAAKNTALDGQYALDSFADVQAATRYFDENWVDFTPAQRHEFAVKTAARAEVLGIPVSDLLNRYGSTEYSPDVEAQLSARKANCEAEFHQMFDELKEKKASIEPEKFAELLGLADEEAGLHWYYGGNIQDNYFSTFGGMSEKQASAAWKWMGRVGDTLNADQLKKLVKEGRGVLKKYFAKEIVNALQADPFAIFDSLPEDSKVIISRLANGEFDAMPIN